MKIRFLIFISLAFVITNCNAQLLEANAWNTFEGKIGDKESQLTLYPFKNGIIKGNYVLKNDSSKIVFRGHLKGNALILTETQNPNSIFKGNLFTDTLDKFDGIKFNNLKNDSIPFKFVLASITWATFEHRYTSMFGTNEEIEKFMKMVKDAILANNKQWIVNHIHLPIRQVLNKGFTSINNKKELLKYYNQIFTANFKDKIRHEFTTNLFNKNGEAMLSNGKIWIANTSKSTPENYGFLIIAINP